MTSLATSTTTLFMNLISLSLTRKQNVLHNIVCNEPVDGCIDAMLCSDLLKKRTTNPLTRSLGTEITILRNYKKLVNNETGCAAVKYKRTTGMNYGRSNPIRSLGLFAFRCEIRHSLASRAGLSDWDMENAHPQILLQICNANNVECPKLQQYCDHRDEMLLNLMEITGCDRWRAKTLGIRIMYLGTFKGWLNGDDDNELKPIDVESFNSVAGNSAIAFFDNFEKEMKRIAKAITNANPQLVEEVKKSKETKDKSYTLGASVMSYFLQEYEIRILEVIFTYAKSKGYISADNRCVLCADGIILEDRLIEGYDIPYEFNRVVQEKTGFNLRFINKPVDQGWTDEFLSEHEKRGESQPAEEQENPEHTPFINCFEDDMALLFIEKWKDFIIFTHGVLYIYNNRYWIRDDDHSIMYSCIADWLRASIKNIPLKTPQIKALKKHTLITALTTMVLKNTKRTPQDHIIFDCGTEQHFNLQFKNGLYDIKKRAFRVREFDDYVTQWLDYDFKESDDIPTVVSNEVLELYRKIQPNPDQRNLDLEFLAYTLTGDIEANHFKMNVGYSAGNGKTTEMSIHHKVLPIYVTKLVRETFSTNYQKRHKHIHKIITNPIRMCYVEELGSNKLDVEFIKEFTSGKNVTCELLFGTEISSNIQSKTIFCSQSDFAVDVDAGFARRGIVQHYTSKFVKDTPENHAIISDANHVYKRVDGIDNKFDDADYKMAYIHMLLTHYKGAKFTIPQSNIALFKEACDDNDTFKANLLANYELCEGATPVFWKDVYFKLGFTQTPANRQLIARDLKRLGVKYEMNLSLGRGKKGAYIGLSSLDDLGEKPKELDDLGENPEEFEELDDLGENPEEFEELEFVEED